MSKGIEWERQLKKDLESLGYSVMRGAGSKGTLFGMKVDLIVSKDTSRNKKTAYFTIVADGVAGAQCKVKEK